MSRALALCLVVLAACGEDFTPTLDNPWHPGSPGDPTCASCTELAEIEDPHAGALVLLGDPSATDPYAQYGRCVMSILACWDDGGELPACVAGSRCPAPCRAEYARLLDGATELRAQVHAIERVFLDRDAPCTQPEVTP